MKHYLKNEKGYALALSIFLVLFVSVIGLSLLKVSAFSLKQVDHERTDQAVYYIAEAGLNIIKADLKEQYDNILNKALNDLKAEMNTPNHGINTETDAQNRYISIIREKYFNSSYINTTPKTITFAPNKFTTLEYTLDSDSLSVSLKSAGDIDEATVRTLQQPVQLNANLFEAITSGSTNDDNTNQPPPPIKFPDEFTAISSGNISVTGGAIIYGNAGSLGGKIKLDGGAKITGQASAASFDLPDWWTDIRELPALPFDTTPFIPTFPSEKFDKGTTLLYPANLEVKADEYNKRNIIDNGNFQADNYVTNNYTLKLEKDTKFKSFIVDQNNNLTIDVGDKDINLYIEDFNIKQGHVKVIGTGTLNLFVTKFTKLKGSFNKNGDSSRVTMYYKGTNKLTFDNETHFYGSLFNNTAPIEFTGGAGFYGNLKTLGEHITISGGVPSTGQYILAPNANIKLTGGGVIRATVLAKRLLQTVVQLFTLVHLFHHKLLHQLHLQ